MPRWLFWTFLTLVSWGLWAVLYRLVAGSLSELHGQAVSTLGVLPILAALWLWKDRPAAGDRRRGIALAFGSGVLSSLGNVACYAALSQGKAAVVVPLTALYPVVTILLAIPLLKERFNLMQFFGICLSLMAIALFNIQAEPGTAGGTMSRWLPWALAAVVLWGITAFMQKLATNHISAVASAIWFLAAFIPVAAGILLYEGLPGNIAPPTWAIATAIGFTLALGNLTILLAYASGGNASIITPLAGLYPLVSIPIALWYFHESLAPREGFAIGLALVAVVLLSFQSAPATAPATEVLSE